MPYVKQELRSELDEYVRFMSNFKLTMPNLTDFLLCISGSLKFSDSNIPLVLISNSITNNTKPDGSINYIVFKYVKYHIKPSYNNYKNVIGAIYEAVNCTTNIEYKNEYREAAEWIRIKLLVPYEEQKILENGDV